MLVINQHLPQPFPAGLGWFAGIYGSRVQQASRRSSQQADSQIAMLLCLATTCNIHDRPRLAQCEHVCKLQKQSSGVLFGSVGTTILY